jgi:hypothetical protein
VRPGIAKRDLRRTAIDGLDRCSYRSCRPLTPKQMGTPSPLANQSGTRTQTSLLLRSWNLAKHAMTLYEVGAFFVVLAQRYVGPSRWSRSKCGRSRSWRARSSAIGAVSGVTVKPIAAIASRASSIRFARANVTVLVLAL